MKITKIKSINRYGDETIKKIQIYKNMKVKKIAELQKGKKIDIKV